MTNAEEADRIARLEIMRHYSPKAKEEWDKMVDKLREEMDRVKWEEERK